MDTTRMTEQSIDSLLDTIRAIGDYCPPEITPPEIYRCQVLPPVPWDKQTIEAAIQVEIPLDLDLLWRKASSLSLFEDIANGQWGLIILAPNEIPAFQREKYSYWGKELIRGDLIIGKFVGDPDIVIVRCDPARDDFGSVVIGKAIAHRNGWFIAAPSVVAFLRAYLDAGGDWFWE